MMQLEERRKRKRKDKWRTEGKEMKGQTIGGRDGSEVALHDGRDGQVREILEREIEAGVIGVGQQPLQRGRPQECRVVVQVRRLREAAGEAVRAARAVKKLHLQAGERPLDHATPSGHDCALAAVRRRRCRPERGVAVTPDRSVKHVLPVQAPVPVGEGASVAARTLQGLLVHVQEVAVPDQEGGGVMDLYRLIRENTSRRRSPKKRKGDIEALTHPFRGPGRERRENPRIENGSAQGWREFLPDIARLGCSASFPLCSNFSTPAGRRLVDTVLESLDLLDRQWASGGRAAGRREIG